MKKKWIIALAAGLVILLFLVGWGYYSIKGYLKDKYSPNTWVNGRYCTGLTAEEVNEQLLRGLQAPSVTVVDDEGKEYVYDLADAGFQYDYSQSLQTYQKNQSGQDFVDVMKIENKISPGEASFTYDEEKLRDWWDDLDIVKAEDEKPILKMTLDDGGYQLQSTLENHLDVDKALNEVVNSIAERNYVVSLQEKDCYFDYEMDESQKQTYETWQELKKLETCGLTYDMGDEKIVFDEALMSKFIAKDEKGNPKRDENGSFYYDLEVAESYMDELCESYHTYGVDRTFKTSRESGDVVIVKAGNFGTEIDKKTEIKYFLEILSDESLRLEKNVHVPKYLHETLHHGLDDTGGTYIEVDKLEQKIYYYQDHKLMVTSGVVTGDLRSRHDTYEGAFCIQAKYKNRILRGPGYASFVRRWMPIYRAIGLHDANWRKEAEFGGETYKKNGSHGCINMPDETTDIIFDNAEIGTPVFIFQ